MIMGEWDLTGPDRLVAERIARTADRLDELQQLVDEDGTMGTTRLGETVVSAAARELRALDLAYARLLATLQIVAAPDGNLVPAGQRHSGARGVYAGLRAVTGGGA
jgi:hypothetical protein